MKSIEFEAIGTHWHIEIEFGADEDSSALFAKIKERIQQFEQTYSRFKPDSLVTHISQHPGIHTLPPDAEPMWSLYKKLYEITHGAFTPLIGSLLTEAGYDASYSLTPKELHKPATWEDAIDDQFPSITIKKPVMIDFGSIGKGYLIDLVGEIIEADEYHDYIINAGGDIRHRGSTTEPLRIALENPSNLEEAIGIATIANGSLCGSSGSRRKWADFHHIMDPRTLASPRHVLAAWTTASSTIIADALATCLFLVPADELRPHFDFEYLIVRPDHSVESSKGFKVELFRENKSEG